jgi:hypothetical protein
MKLRALRALRAFGALVGASLAVFLMAGPASAGTISQPNTNPFQTSPAPATCPTGAVCPTTYTFDASFTIVYAGFPARTNVFATMCDGLPPSTPGYDPNFDCDNGTTTPAAPSDVNGAGTFPAFDHNLGFYPVHGIAPSGNWSCVAPGEPNPLPGFPFYTNCQLKVTVNQSLVNPGDALLTLTLAPPGGQVPEVPYAILLPLGAAVLLTGGYVISRRRRNAHAAA